MFAVPTGLLSFCLAPTASVEVRSVCVVSRRITQQTDRKRRTEPRPIGNSYYPVVPALFKSGGYNETEGHRTHLIHGRGTSTFYEQQF